MKALIVEKEVYLAQGIASKMADLGYECVISDSVDDTLNTPYFDVILLAHSTVGRYAELIIKHHRNSIVIMIINYINDDTVTKPLNAGAKDYILKPFMIDELMRKISHHKEHKKLSDTNDFMNAFIGKMQDNMSIPSPSNTIMPFVIKASMQIQADLYAMKYCTSKGLTLDFIDLRECSIVKLEGLNRHHSKIYYITHLEEVRQADLPKFFELVNGLPAIVSSVVHTEIDFPRVVDLSNLSDSFSFMGDVIPIKEYEQIIIKKFENKYPDIELAKKLGVSRKSLWEKRKKYDLNRKKSNSH